MAVSRTYAREHAGWGFRPSRTAFRREAEHHSGPKVSTIEAKRRWPYISPRTVTSSIAKPRLAAAREDRDAGQVAAVPCPRKQNPEREQRSEVRILTLTDSFA